MLRALSLALIALLTWPAAVQAASITVELTSPRFPASSSIGVHLDGAIAPGDAERLGQAIDKTKATGRRFLGVYLNSPGGDLPEGVALGRLISQVGATIFLTHESVCASACFLSLVAGSYKPVSRGARGGVHSAGIDCVEVGSAPAGTLVMARMAADLGAPPAIVGRMVLTQPKGMTWLSEDELVTIKGIRKIYTDLP